MEHVQWLLADSDGCCGRDAFHVEGVVIHDLAGGGTIVIVMSIV